MQYRVELSFDDAFHLLGIVSPLGVEDRMKPPTVMPPDSETFRSKASEVRA